jgi:intraflagellar transport protein 80
MATLSISPYPKILYEQVDKADFEKSIRLCRFVKEQTLWACLAAMSIYCRELNTVEIALAAIDEADKVRYINYVKELPSEAARNSALALYCKKVTEAEQILLQNKLFYRAIKMNIKLYKWDRALDIAIQHQTHVDTVIAYRQRFLDQYGKEETNEKFKQYKQEIGDVDWNTIKAKISADKEKEAATG